MLVLLDLEPLWSVTAVHQTKAGPKNPDSSSLSSFQIDKIIFFKMHLGSFLLSFYPSAIMMSVCSSSELVWKNLIP